MRLHFSVLFDGNTSHSGNGKGGAGLAHGLLLFRVYCLVYLVVDDSLLLFSVTADPCLMVGISWRESLQEGKMASAEEQGGADEG